jgi:hypothetical protein
MLIECLTLREGITLVPFKMHIYEFMPIPGALEGEQSTSVCNVPDQEAVDYFIGNSAKIPPIKGRPNFRAYRPKQAQDEMLVRRKKVEAYEGKLRGYSIDVLNLMGNDRGYVIKHKDEDGKIKFCGANSVWTDDIQKVWPFVKISDADSWLKSFAAGMPDKPMENKKTPYLCGECEKIFDNPIDLADHWKATHVKKEDKLTPPPTTQAINEPTKKVYQTPKG